MLLLITVAIFIYFTVLSEKHLIWSPFLAKDLLQFFTSKFYKLFQTICMPVSVWLIVEIAKL